MSTDTAVAPRRDESRAPASPGGGSTADGARSSAGDRVRSDVRAMSFDQGAARVQPPSSSSSGGEAQAGEQQGPGGQTMTPRPQAAPEPRGPSQAMPPAGPGADGASGPAAAAATTAQPEPFRDPSRDPAFRQNTLRWAHGRIERIQELMSYGAFDWAITDAEATEALGMIEAVAGPARLVVVDQLLTTNAGGRLYDNTPEAAKRRFPRAFSALAVATNHVVALQPLLRTAPTFIQGDDAALVQRVMSALTDVDIRVAATGIASREAMATSAFNQWIGKTPEPPKSDIQRRFQGVAETVMGVAQRHAAEQQQAQADERTLAGNAHLRDQIHDVEGLLSYGVFDWAITDAEARRVFDILAGLGAAELSAAVHRLDRGPFMDRFLDNLAETDRWGPRKLTFLGIIRARSPEKNLRFVSAMLDHFFGFMTSSEEARLAFEIVRVMPRDIQDQFRLANNGEWWNRMTGHIDQRQANDRDQSLYDNAEQTQQRKLDFQANCARWDDGQLRTNLEMLCRMREDRFVEEQLQRAGVIASKPWITATYGFAANGPRNAEVYTAWLENRSADRRDVGFFDRAGGILDTAARGVVAAGSHVLHADHTTDLDLNRVQNAAGGDLGGMVMADRRPGHDDDNRISVSQSRSTGAYGIRGRTLNIASYSGVSGERTIQTGPIGIAGIEVDFKYPTERDPSSRFHLKLPAVVARDIAIMERASMSTVGDLEVHDLVIDATTAPGAVPQDEAQAQTAMLGQVEQAVKQLMAALRGVNTQPDQVSAALTNSFASLSATVSIGSITASRVGGSDGSYVERAEVHGVGITVTNARKGDTIRARLAELERQAQARALTAEEAHEKQELDRQLPQVTLLEAEERRLGELERSHHISMADQDRLGQIRSELTIHRATVDVADLQVHNARGLSGADAGDLRMQGMRAEVSGEGVTGQAGASTARVDASVREVTGSQITMRGTNRLEATEAALTELRAKIREGRASAEEREREGTLSAQVAEVHRNLTRRDELRLQGPAANQEELQRVQALVAPWEGRQASTHVDAMNLQGVEAHAQMGASGTSASMRVREAHLQGVDQGEPASGGRHIDRLDASQVALAGEVRGDTRPGAGSEGSMLSRLSSGRFDAARLEMAGYHAAGQSLSQTLITERTQLEQTRALHPEQLTEAQAARLASMERLIGEAQQAERRLADLRAREHGTPPLTREERAELQALATRCDPHTMDVRALHATDVRAVADEGGVGLAAGHAGSGQAGLTMEGFQQGTVGPGGARTTSRSIDRMSMESVEVGATARGGLGGLADTAGLGANGSGLDARVRATGLDMRGFTQGQAGQAGYQHVDAIHADRASMGYQEAHGGSAQVSLEGASATGITRQSGRLDALDQAIAQYTAQESSGRPLDAGQQRRLAELRADRHQYEALQTRLAAARGPAARRRIEAEIATWERVSEQRIASVGAGRVDASLTGVGNVMSDQWNLADQDVGARGSVSDLRVGRVANVDERGREHQVVASATANDIRFNGSNVLGANGARSQIHADVGELDARGVHAGGASVGHVHGRGLSATATSDVDPRHAGRRTTGVNGSLRQGNVSGVSASGATVGSASMSNATFGVSNVGERDQRTNLGAGSVSASNIAYRGGGTSARIHDVHGSGLGLSMGGGGISGGMRSFQGHGVNVDQAGQDGASTHADVAEFHGRQAAFANRGGAMNASFGNIGGRDVNYRGVAGASMEANNATVANPNAGQETNAHVDSFEVNGVHADVRGGQVRASAQSGTLEGVRGNQTVVRDGATIGNRSGSAGRVSVDGASVELDNNTGDFDARMRRLNVADGHFSETRVGRDTPIREGATGPQGVTVNDLHVGGNRERGDVSAQFSTITGDRLTFRDDATPANRMNVVMNQLQVGSPTQLSTVTWDGHQVTDATIQGLRVGANSHINMGSRAHEDPNNGELQLGAGDQGNTRLALQNGIRTGQIRVRNLDPNDLGSAGSQFQIRDIDGSGALYNGPGRTLVLTRGTVDRVFMEGTGNGRMVVGAAGVRGDLTYSEDVANVGADGHATGGVHRQQMFGGRDVRVQEAYAVLDRSRGNEWRLVESQIRGVSGEELNIHMAPAGREAGDRARAEAARNPQPRTEMTLEMIQHMNGSVRLDVDLATLAPDSRIARALRDVSLTIPVRDGSFTVADIEAAVRGHGFSGAELSYVVGAVAGALIPGMSAGTGGALSYGASHIPVPASLIQRGIEAGVNHTLNDNSAPEPAEWKRGVRISANMSVEGGMSYGNTFSTEVQHGTQVGVSGTLDNTHVGVRNAGLGNTQVNAGGGTAQIDQINARSIDVDIRDQATPGRRDVQVQVRGGRIENINFRPDGEQHDANAANVARRNASGPGI